MGALTRWTHTIHHSVAPKSGQFSSIPSSRNFNAFAGVYLMGLQPIQRDETFDQRVGRTPWSARVPLDPLPQASTNTSSRPTWASAADQGVRPTLHSSVRDKVFRATRVAHVLFGAASSKDPERTAH